jgi:hypothetical protein
VPLLVDLSTTGFADVPLAACLACSAVLWSRYLSGGYAGSPVMAMYVTGGLILIKKEGILLAGLVLIGVWSATALRSGALRAAILGAKSVGAALVIGGPWLWFAHWHPMPSADFLPITFDVFVTNIERLSFTAWWFGVLALAPGVLGLVWPLLAVVAIVHVAELRRPEVAMLAVICLGALILNLVVFVFSSWTPYTEHVRNALDRLILQITPVGVLLAGEMLAADSGK